MDLQQELDRAIGDGPEHRPLADRLTAGRRAVRRRRLRRTAAGSALAATVGVGAVLGGLPGLLGSDTAAPAGDAAPAADDPWPAPRTSTKDERAMRRDQLRQCGVELSAASGRHPRLAAGASIVERVDDPVPRSRADHSVALDVRLADGQHRWVVIGWSGGHASGGGCDDPARPGPYATFAEFVAGKRKDGDGMQL